MKFAQMIESKFLKQDNIEGEEVVTIQGFKQMNVAPEDKPQEMKWVVKFKEKNQPLVLNNTNIQMLGLIAPTQQEAIGKQCVLYVDHSVMFGGKLVGGVRIKPMNSNAGKDGWTQDYANAEAQMAGRTPGEDDWA